MAKDSPRIEAIGAVDELNSLVGMARGALERAGGRQAIPSGKVLRDAEQWLQRVQQCLFNAGSRLAAPEERFRMEMPKIGPDDLAMVESWIDTLNGELGELTTFVLPGGGETTAWLHVARAVCRRAERETWRLHRLEPVEQPILQYLNRLSDFLFVLARRVAKQLGEPEYFWDNKK